MQPIDKLKMLFGFLLLAVLGALGAAIGLGKVHQETSYGLEFILGTLTTMGGAFSNWAYGYRASITDQPEKPKPAEPATNA
jgi:hypothetical protein